MNIPQDAISLPYELYHYRYISIFESFVHDKNIFLKRKISQGVRNPPNLIQIQDLDDERQLSISISTIISLHIENFSRSALDHLDGISTYCSHK